MIKQLFSGVLLTLAMTAYATEVVKSETAKPATKTRPTPIKVAMHAPVQHQPLAAVVLSPEQLTIADRVLTGKINCELAVVVTMTPDTQSPGQFFLEIGNKRHVMVPVVTSTGAVRMEDESSGAVWLQLGNKSMLMNQKEGKRLADECMNPDQLLVAQALERNPQPGLLDAPKDALVAIGAGGAVQELVPNPEPKPKAKSKPKSK